MLKGKIKLKIGLFTPGMAAYWSQMPGIKEEIEGYAAEIEANLSRYGEVISAGMVDTVQKARETREKFQSGCVDILFIHIGTYAPSQMVLETLHGLNLPIVTLHLQPVDNFTEITHSGYTIPKNTFSAGGEVGNVLIRAGIKFHSIVGRLHNDTKIWKQVGEWCAAAFIKKALAYTNIALLGNYYCGMCDLYADMAMITYQFGVNIELLEMGALRKCVETVSNAEIAGNYAKTKKMFTFVNEIQEDKLQWCNQVAVGMKKLSLSYDLSAIAFNYGGFSDSVEEKIGYSLTLGGSMLTAEGIPCLAEGDILLTIPALIMGYLSGGATQAEINVADYISQCSYIGHAGPGDFSIAQDGPYLRWLDFFHGKKGNGVSCEFSLKQGPVTLVSLVQDHGGKYKLIFTEATAVSGERLKNGNVNTRVAYKTNIEDFFPKWMAEGPSHHSILCLGHHASELHKLANIMEIAAIEI